MPPELIVVLDTDVWSHLYGSRRKIHPGIQHWSDLLVGRTVVIATQTRAEVIAGMCQGNWGPDRMEKLMQQLDATPTVPVDEKVVQRYARLTADARVRGDGLGGAAHTGDRWTAATALPLDAPLLALGHIYRQDPDLTLWPRETGYV